MACRTGKEAGDRFKCKMTGNTFKVHREPGDLQFGMFSKGILSCCFETAYENIFIQMLKISNHQLYALNSGNVVFPGRLIRYLQYMLYDR